MNEREYKTPLNKRLYERERRRKERALKKALGIPLESRYRKVDKKVIEIIEETEEARKTRLDKRKEYNRRYLDKNRQSINEKRKKYNSERKELIAEYSKKSRQKLKPKTDFEKEQFKEKCRKEYEERKAYFIAYHSMRRAEKISRTPAWADRKAIAAIYKSRLDIEKETGIPHHVDHIVPLRGKLVCGLHVEYNLRVIPAEENLKKRNWLFEELL